MTLASGRRALETIGDMTFAIEALIRRYGARVG